MQKIIDKKRKSEKDDGRSKKRLFNESNRTKKLFQGVDYFLILESKNQRSSSRLPRI